MGKRVWTEATKRQHSDACKNKGRLTLVQKLSIIEMSNRPSAPTQVDALLSLCFVMRRADSHQTCTEWCDAVQAEIARTFQTSRMTICKLLRIENQTKVLGKARSLAAQSIDLHHDVQVTRTEAEADTEPVTEPSLSWDVSTGAWPAETAEPSPPTTFLARRTASDPGPWLTTGIECAFDGSLLFRSLSEPGSLASSEPGSFTSFSDEDLQERAADIDIASEPVKQRVVTMPAGTVDLPYAAPWERQLCSGSHDCQEAPAAQCKAQEQCPRHEEQPSELAPALQFSLLSLFPAVNCVTRSGHQLDHSGASMLDHRLTSDDKLAWLIELDADTAEHN